MVTGRFLSALLLLAAAGVRAQSSVPDSAGAAASARIVAELAIRVEGQAAAHEIGPAPRPDADLYKRYISSQDGPHCTFHLSCSAYAKQAIREKGLFTGILLAADRLLRCHGLGAAQYPSDPVSGKLLDPVP